MNFGIDYKKEGVNKSLENKLRELQKISYANFDIFLEEVLRTKAIPPVKGELTRNKIKWRGIKLCQRDMGAGYYVWVEQRGKQISTNYWTHYPDEELNNQKEIRNGLES